MGDRGSVIFLSYASEHSALAEDVYMALTMDGHDVFLDQKCLQAGEASDASIRAQIERCDLLVLLVAPILFEKEQSYALTELREAQRRWRDPSGRVLPVIVAPTDRRKLPSYIKRLVALHPEGDVAAEVASEVDSLLRRRGPDPRPTPAPIISEAQLFAYRSLWRLTGKLPKWGKGPERTYEDLAQLSRELREWYFEESGGLFLSKGAYSRYAALQESLRLLTNQERPGALTDDDFEYIRGHCSSLRRFIATEIGTRL